jgi:hypothetical protein
MKAEPKVDESQGKYRCVLTVLIFSGAAPNPLQLREFRNNAKRTWNHCTQS